MNWHTFKDWLLSLWPTQKAWLASVWAGVVSVGLQGWLQITVLIFAVIAGYYSMRYNKAKAELMENEKYQREQKMV